MREDLQRRTGNGAMATSEKRLTQVAALSADRQIEFGSEICADLTVAEQREWLVTIGIGGFASGTISGNPTRRYHGLLIAAFHPPVGRTQLVAKVEETASYDGMNCALATNRWVGGAVEPRGYVHLQSFRLEGAVPVWQFAIGDALLEKRIWMQHGENTTYVQYCLARGSKNLALSIKMLVNYRDYHSSTHAGNWQMNVGTVPNGIQ